MKEAAILLEGLFLMR